MSYPLPIAWKEYAAAAWATDLDLTDEVTGCVAVVLRVKTAGSGALVYRSKGAPADETLTGLTAGMEFHGQFEAIDATTSLDAIFVGFADASLPEV